jgi:hypothetical protein
MFDKLLTRTHTRAEHELDDQMRGQRQTIKEALATPSLCRLHYVLNSLALSSLAVET